MLPPVRVSLIFLNASFLLRLIPLTHIEPTTADGVSSTNGISNFFVGTNGKYLPHNVIETWEHSTAVDCSFKCLNNKDCKSFNIRSAGAACELNRNSDVTIGSQNLIDEAGSRYYLKYPEDCSDYDGADGVHWVYIQSMKKSIEVYCQQGWTVLMRRTGPELNFNRGWDEYRDGFGDVAGDHWLGLEAFHHLTNQGNYSLMTEVRDMLTDTYFSDIHVGFRVSSEDEAYTLDITPGGVGNLSANGTSSRWNQFYKFTTLDRDNDIKGWANCAVLHGGGWWYRACSEITLTAKMATPSSCTSSCWRWAKHVGIPFGDNGSDDILLRSAVMKIRK